MISMMPYHVITEPIYFLSHYPQAQASLTSVPPELVETSQPDWISPHWTRLWTTISISTSTYFTTHIHISTTTLFMILHKFRTCTSASFRTSIVPIHLTFSKQEAHTLNNKELPISSSSHTNNLRTP